MDGKLITFALALSFVITFAKSCYSKKEGTCEFNHIVFFCQIVYSSMFISHLHLLIEFFRLSQKLQT